MRFSAALISVSKGAEDFDSQLLNAFFVDVDRVFNMQKKRFFVLYPETAEVVVYRDKKNGQAIDRLDAVTLTGDTALSVEDRVLFVVCAANRTSRLFRLGGRGV